MLSPRETIFYPVLHRLRLKSTSIWQSKFKQCLLSFAVTPSALTGQQDCPMKTSSSHSLPGLNGLNHAPWQIRPLFSIPMHCLHSQFNLCSKSTMVPSKPSDTSFHPQKLQPSGARLTSWKWSSKICWWAILKSSIRKCRWRWVRARMGSSRLTMMQLQEFQVYIA